METAQTNGRFSLALLAKQGTLTIPEDDDRQSTMLILIGDRIVPDDLTEIFCYEPYQGWQKGERRRRPIDASDGSPRYFEGLHSTGGWKLLGPSTQDGLDLPAQIKALCRFVEQTPGWQTYILEYPETDATIDGNISVSSSYSITLPSDTAGRLAEQRLGLQLSFYPSVSLISDFYMHSNTNSVYRNSVLTTKTVSLQLTAPGSTPTDLLRRFKSTCTEYDDPNEDLQILNEGAVNVLLLNRLSENSNLEMQMATWLSWLQNNNKALQSLIPQVKPIKLHFDIVSEPSVLLEISSDQLRQLAVYDIDCEIAFTSTRE